MVFPSDVAHRSSVGIGAAGTRAGSELSNQAFSDEWHSGPRHGHAPMDFPDIQRQTPTDMAGSGFERMLSTGIPQQILKLRAHDLDDKAAGSHRAISDADTRRQVTRPHDG
jgi:hypothetical protein